MSSKNEKKKKPTFEKCYIIPKAIFETLDCTASSGNTEVEFKKNEDIKSNPLINFNDKKKNRNDSSDEDEDRKIGYHEDDYYDNFDSFFPSDISDKVKRFVNIVRKYPHIISWKKDNYNIIINTQIIPKTNIIEILSYIFKGKFYNPPFNARPEGADILRKVFLELIESKNIIDKNLSDHFYNRGYLNDFRSFNPASLYKDQKEIKDKLDEVLDAYVDIKKEQSAKSTSPPPLELSSPPKAVAKKKGKKKDRVNNPKAHRIQNQLAGDIEKMKAGEKENSPRKNRSGMERITVKTKKGPAVSLPPDSPQISMVEPMQTDKQEGKKSDEEEEDEFTDAEESKTDDKNNKKGAQAGSGIKKTKLKVNKRKRILQKKYYQTLIDNWLVCKHS